MSELSDRMEFDHPIVVTDDGSVSDAVGVYAPESYIGTDADGSILPEHDAAWIAALARAGWEPLDGYSGQCGYSGPILHSSEFIGGDLARDILATPGVYVAVTVECEPTDAEPEPEPAGWAVLRRR
jgi:hypothetical protein